MTGSFGAGIYDIWLIKTDADGNDIWKKTFGGSDCDPGSSDQLTCEGSDINNRETQSYGAGGADVWLIKTDADGNEVWDKTLGGSDSDRGHSVQQTSDGGYIIAGVTESFGAGAYDVWLIKIEADCVNQPRGDLNGDCKVDFKDVAAMASEWMTCGRHSSIPCW